jgi:hypothetical protein
LKGAKGVKGSRFDDRRGEAPWPKDRPEYVQFVLAKQNLVWKRCALLYIVMVVVMSARRF